MRALGLFGLLRGLLEVVGLGLFELVVLSVLVGLCDDFIKDFVDASLALLEVA